MRRTATRLARLGHWLRDHQSTIRRIQWAVVLFYALLVLIPAFLPLPGYQDRLWSNLTLFAQFLFWGIWWPFVLLSILLFGRLWCGLFCPEGTLSEWASRHGRGRSIPRWLRWPGWPLVAFITTTIYGQLISVYQYPKAALLILGGSTLVAMLTGYLFGRNQRVWCRYLCPVSGVFALLAKLSPLHFVTDRRQWADYRREERRIPAVQCPTFLPLRQLDSASPCHLCGRCAGYRDAIELKTRAPGTEVVTTAATTATPWDYRLIVFGLLGVAAGAFHWSASPWFVRLKLYLAEVLIEHGWIWPLDQQLPWWLLTHYPAQNDVFRVLDGVALLLYIGATTLVSGTVVTLCLVLASFGPDRGSRQRLYHLSQGLIPTAAAGVFLGLSTLTLSLLRSGHWPLGWVDEARLALLAAAGLWSLWLGWRIAGTYRKGPARLVSMAAYGAAVAWATLIWWLLFFGW